MGKNKQFFSKAQFKVFGKRGMFVETVSVGKRCKFKTMQQLEEYLQKRGLYAHRIESFVDRPYWKGWTFKQKLENLGWKFDSNGELTNTEW